MKKLIWIPLLSVLFVSLLSGGLYCRSIADKIESSRLPEDQEVVVHKQELFPVAEEEYFNKHPDALAMLYVMHDVYIKRVIPLLPKQEFTIAIIDDDQTDRHKMIFTALKRLFPKAQFKCIHTSAREKIAVKMPTVEIYNLAAGKVIGCHIYDSPQTPFPYPVCSWLYYFKKVENKVLLTEAAKIFGPYEVTGRVCNDYRLWSISGANRLDGHTTANTLQDINDNDFWSVMAAVTADKRFETSGLRLYVAPTDKFAGNYFSQLAVFADKCNEKRIPYEMGFRYFIGETEYFWRLAPTVGGMASPPAVSGSRDMIAVNQRTFDSLAAARSEIIRCIKDNNQTRINLFFTSKICEKKKLVELVRLFLNDDGTLIDTQKIRIFWLACFPKY